MQTVDQQSGRRGIGSCSLEAAARHCPHDGDVGEPAQPNKPCPCDGFDRVSWALSLACLGKIE